MAQRQRRVATGAESGIAVVDVDLPAALASLDRLIVVGLPVTLTGLTGGGGLHLIYMCADPALGNSAGRLPGLDGELPGIDLRATAATSWRPRVRTLRGTVTSG